MRTLLITLASLMLVAGCGEGVSPEPLSYDEPTLAPPPVVTLASRLSELNAVPLQVTRSSAGVIQVRQPAETFEFTPLALRATGGTVRVRLTTHDGHQALQVEQLVVSLADVAVLDSGVELTALHFHLAPAALADVTWNKSRTALTAQMKATLLVSGSWRLAGHRDASPFETQVFVGVPLTVSVSLDEQEHLVARFGTAGHQTPSWSWGGLLETGAAAFNGEATEVAREFPVD